MTLQINEVAAGYLARSVLFSYGSYSGPDIVRLTVTGGSTGVMYRAYTSGGKILLSEGNEGTVIVVK